MYRLIFFRQIIPIIPSKPANITKISNKKSEPLHNHNMVMTINNLTKKIE